MLVPNLKYKLLLDLHKKFENPSSFSSPNTFATEVSGLSFLVADNLGGQALFAPNLTYTNLHTKFEHLITYRPILQLSVKIKKMEWKHCIKIYT